MNSINHFITKHNLKVIYAYDNTAPIVSVQLFIKTGSIFESEDEAGFSHFLEHLVFKSTKKYPKNSIIDTISFYGGNINAGTDYESTCFYINIPSEHIKIAIDILFELFYHTNFDEEDFESEKKVVIEELKQYQNDPEDYLVESIPALVFKQNPYINPIIGNKQSLEKATRHDLMSFYKKHYHNNNAFFVVAGEFDLGALNNMMLSGGEGNSEFGIRNMELPATAIISKTRKSIGDEILPNSEFRIPNSVMHSFKLPISKNIIAFAMPEVADTHPLSNALHLVSKAFAIGKNSRLYQRLCIEEGLVDTLKVNSISGLYDGLMIILAFPRKNSDIEKIIKIFIEELKIIKKFGIKNDEIDDIKKELINSSQYVFEYMEVLAHTLGTEEIFGDYKVFFDYDKDVLNISKDDIQQVINQYLNQSKLHIVIGGKEKHRVSIPKYNYISKAKQELDKKPIILKNGLKVILLPTLNKNICGVALALGVSQLDEDQTNLGLNQLTSTLLLYGNAKRDYEQSLQFCCKNGIQLGVSNGKETAKIRLKCFSHNVYEGIELIKDSLSTPIFPQKHFTNLKKTFISHIHRISDYPQSEATLLWKKMIFGENSNILTKDGSIKTLEAIHKQDILNWYEKKIINAPGTMCVIGNFDPEKMIDFIEKHFSHLHFKNELPHRSIILNPSKINKIVLDKNSDQAIINLGGFCMKGRDTEQRASMYIISQLIGNESRMFNLLREKHGLAYSVDFDYDLLQDFGYYVMYAIVDKKNADFAVELLYQMQDDIKKEGITDEEITRAKNYILGHLKMDEESVLTKAQVISSLLTMGFDYDFYLQREDRVKNATKESIMQILNQYFNKEDQFLHILC